MTPEKQLRQLKSLHDELNDLESQKKELAKDIKGIKEEIAKIFNEDLDQTLLFEQTQEPKPPARPTIPKK